MILRKLFEWIIPVVLIALCGIAIVCSAGIAWPDEIFQTVEPAYHLVTGKGHISWEFEKQARSFLYPYFLSGCIYLFQIFSDSTAALYYFLRIILSLFFVASGLVIYRSFLKTGSPRESENPVVKSILFLIFWCFTPIFYYFGFRTLTESISTSLVLISVFSLEYFPEKLGPKKIFFLSLLLGMVFGIRFQTGIFFVVYYPLFIFKLYNGNKKSLVLPFIAGAVAGLLIYGTTDYLYYGIPFISSINYFKFNIIEGVASEWGVSPFHFYFQMYFRYFEFLNVFIFVGLWTSFRNHFSFIIPLFIYVLVHSFVPHKELRFAYLSFPVLAFFASVGIREILNMIFRKSPKISGIFFVIIAMYAISLNVRVAQKKIPWNFADQNLKTFLEMSKLKLNGNVLVGIHGDFACCAGYTYLGKNFEGKLYYRNIANRTEKQIQRIVEKRNIRYLLLETPRSGAFCKENLFCEKIISNQSYSLLKKI